MLWQPCALPTCSGGGNRKNPTRQSVYTGYVPALLTKQVPEIWFYASEVWKTVQCSIGKQNGTVSQSTVLTLMSSQFTHTDMVGPNWQQTPSNIPQSKRNDLWHGMACRIIPITWFALTGSLGTVYEIWIMDLGVGCQQRWQDKRAWTKYSSMCRRHFVFWWKELFMFGIKNGTKVYSWGFNWQQSRIGSCNDSQQTSNYYLNN